MMIRLAALTLLTLVSAAAQPSNAAPSDRRVVEVKHLRGPRLDQAVKLLTTFLLPGDATSYPDLNSVVLRGTPESTAAAEALLKKFDVPVAPMRVESRRFSSWQLRIYVVQGVASGAGGQIPAELSTAVDEMKKSFLYTGYRLLETVILPGRMENGAEVEGMLPDADLGEAMYSARVSIVHPVDDGKLLQLSSFSFVIKRPLRLVHGQPETYRTARIGTDLTIRPGQKLVVGKLSAEQNGNAIFLILTAEPIS